MSEKKTKYVSLSIPVDIAKDIDELIEELGYWPSRSAFAREACLEKIREERRRLRELREAEEAQSTRRESPGD
jgi:Arc/MetJ-type ribon-helix-helix transcriptional regulator